LAVRSPLALASAHRRGLRQLLTVLPARPCTLLAALLTVLADSRRSLDPAWPLAVAASSIHSELFVNYGAYMKIYRIAIKNRDPN
jgi:hypothetical protein